MLENLTEERKLAFKKEIKAKLEEIGFEKGPMVAIYPAYINVVGKYKGNKVIIKTKDYESITINHDAKSSRVCSEISTYGHSLLRIFDKYKEEKWK